MKQIIMRCCASPDRLGKTPDELHISMSNNDFRAMRMCIAQHISADFAKYYGEFMSRTTLLEEFEEIAPRMNSFTQNHTVHAKVVSFLTQSEYAGEITYGACRQLLRVLQRNKCCMKPPEEFINLLTNCVASKSPLAWRTDEVSIMRTIFQFKRKEPE